MINETAVPMLFNIWLIDVAVTLSCNCIFFYNFIFHFHFSFTSGGNHVAEMAGGIDVTTMPGIPFKIAPK